MYQGKKILAVVPARGGSKGVPLKNIRPLHGIPLVAWTGRFLQQLVYVDRAVVSTDHPQIAEIAKQNGLEAPFLRPEFLSGDRIGDWDVLCHALTEMEQQDNKTYDVVLMLQPTSPLRKPEHVTQCLEKLITGGFDSVWTISETDVKYHPLKQLTLQNDHLNYFDPTGSQIIARQQLTPVYHRNSAVYAITRECLLHQKNIKGQKSSAIVIHEPMISIDTEEDFRRCEVLLEKPH